MKQPVPAVILQFPEGGFHFVMVVSVIRLKPGFSHSPEKQSQKQVFGQSVESVVKPGDVFPQFKHFGPVRENVKLPHLAVGAGRGGGTHFYKILEDIKVHLSVRKISAGSAGRHQLEQGGHIELPRFQPGFRGLERGKFPLVLIDGADRGRPFRTHRHAVAASLGAFSGNPGLFINDLDGVGRTYPDAGAASGAFSRINVGGDGFAQFESGAFVLLV